MSTLLKISVLGASLSNQSVLLKLGDISSPRRQGWIFYHYFTVEVNQIEVNLLLLVISRTIMDEMFTTNHKVKIYYSWVNIPPWPSRTGPHSGDLNTINLGHTSSFILWNGTQNLWWWRGAEESAAAAGEYPPSARDSFCCLQTFLLLAMHAGASTLGFAIIKWEVAKMTSKSFA